MYSCDAATTVVAVARRGTSRVALETESTANGRAVLDTVGTGGNYSIDADDSVGLTFQAGVDINLSDKLMFNAAIWKMDIGTTIEVANTLRVDLEIDPWVYMLGFGYKF